MSNILLDVNVVVDFCCERVPHFEPILKALRLAEQQGDVVWLYVASVQTLEYVLSNELRRKAAISGRQLDFLSSHAIAKKQLTIFSRNKHWLAAISEDGPVFRENDAEDAQLVRAVRRLGGKAYLLTRDKTLQRQCKQAVSPDEYVGLKRENDPFPFIDLSSQQRKIRPRMERRMFNVLSHGKYIMGPEVSELESQLADYVGVNHCVSCSSGTDALLMALMAKDIGPGDAILTTPFTFFATAEVIALLGAIPIFVDIDAQTFNMDPDALERAVDALNQEDWEACPMPRAAEAERLVPKGIIAVDLFGQPCDYDRINAIASKNNLFVIEDAAQSMGAQYKGRRANALAEIGCTSFFPAKPLGGYGDGGAVFTDSDGIAEELVSIRVHGQGSDKYENRRIGLNGRLDTLQAAVLLTKLEIFPEEIDFRQAAADRYARLLADYSSSLTSPFVPDDMNSVWAQYSVLAKDAQYRERVQKGLSASAIPTAIYYPRPLHLQTAFSQLGYQAGDFPVSEDVGSRIFSLPMHPYLTEAVQQRIVDEIKRRLDGDDT